MTVAPAATDNTRSPRPAASITDAVAPAPMIVSGVVPVTFRSPVALSSAPTGAIDNVYVPAPSTIVFDTLPAVPQSLPIPGELAAAIASRSEHK